jgi:hypothetical protein
MEEHALAILKEAESWEWPVAKRIQKEGDLGGKYDANTPRLLYYLITESQKLHGSVLDQFWDEVGKCHPKLAESGRLAQSCPMLSSYSLVQLPAFGRIRKSSLPVNPRRRYLKG